MARPNFTGDINRLCLNIINKDQFVVSGLPFEIAGPYGYSSLNDENFVLKDELGG